MKTLYLFFLILGLSFSNTFSQSLSGSTRLRSTKAISESSSNSIESKEDSRAMKYGNVEAYDKDNKLIGSVLTDEFGNYELNFKDTGTYNIKIMYAGYETIEESVTVNGDDESDFSLDRDKLKKERELSEKVYSMEAGFVDGSVYLSGNNAQISTGK